MDPQTQETISAGFYGSHKIHQFYSQSLKENAVFCLNHLSASRGPLISPAVSFTSVGTVYSPARGKEHEGPCEEETMGLGGTGESAVEASLKAVSSTALHALLKV